MPQVVLVVDDSMLIRHTICRYLEERGFAVESAANGQDALEIIQRTRPHLIITDMQMPRMNGTEFISALKGSPETEKIPVVIVSGRHNEAAKQEKRAEMTIYKDIEIEDQLAFVLQSVLPATSAKAQTAGN